MVFGNCSSEDDVLDNLAILYRAQLSLVKDARERGKVPAFNMAYFFADILDCLGRLDYEALVRVMGESVASKIWDEVKPFNGRAN